MATIPRCESPQSYESTSFFRFPLWRSLRSPSPSLPSLEASLCSEGSLSESMILITPESSLCVDDRRHYVAAKPSLTCDSQELLSYHIAAALQDELSTPCSHGQDTGVALRKLTPTLQLPYRPPSSKGNHEIIRKDSRFGNEQPTPVNDCRLLSTQPKAYRIEEKSRLNTYEIMPNRDNPPEPVCDLSAEVETTEQFSVAHGGFSDIYRGIWRGVYGERADTLVAIKLLRAFTRQEVDPVRARKVRQRLNREVYVWKRLRHINIAKFYGISFRLGGRPSLVMQWYQNGTVPDYIDNQRAIGIEVDKVLLVKDIAEGLYYLHSLNPPVVHGDLKGNNTLVSDDGRAMLTDFGLSKVIEELAGPTGNTTSTCAGSVRWQAPELIFDPVETFDEKEEEGDDTFKMSSPTRASDVWSFACTVYEIMTGNIPYHTRLHDWTVIQAIVDRQYPVHQDDRAVLGMSGLMPLLQSCWQYDMEKRPEMRDVVHKLRQP